MKHTANIINISTVLSKTDTGNTIGYHHVMKQAMLLDLIKITVLLYFVLILLFQKLYTLLNHKITLTA